MVRLVFGMLALTLVPLSRSALAVDGLIEINQARALAGGVTPGDNPGFPVAITTSGSYVLTGNLDVSDPSVNGISIFANDVTIDLGGFRISGPLQCPPAEVACPAPTTLVDSRGISSEGEAIHVRNGHVRGFTRYGISLNAGVVSNVSATSNGFFGIRVGRGQVVDSTASRNGGPGISTSNAIVRDCVANLNRQGGILAVDSLVTGSQASGNLGFGIQVSGHGSVRGNTANHNGSDGIQVVGFGNGALVIDNVADQNTGAGISVVTSSSVQRNLVRGNAIGLYLIPEAGGNAAAYRENVADGNSVANVSGGVNLGDNSCNGTTNCP